MPDPTRYEPDTRQTAAFDQNYAHIGGQVDQLITTYRNLRAENEMPRSLDIAGVTGWLVEESGLGRAELAELLTVAVVRLAEMTAALDQPASPT